MNDNQEVVTAGTPPKRPVFTIDQIAIGIAPHMYTGAIQLLEDLGLTGWIKDLVHAEGHWWHFDADDEIVTEGVGENYASLGFHRSATKNTDGLVELETIEYPEGAGNEKNNWLGNLPKPLVTHISTHCTEEELEQFDQVLADHGIYWAQDVETVRHSNPHIVEGGWNYHYRIYHTRPLLGVDLKFIVRK